MITKRNHEQRGPTDAGWLKSLHSFSFGGYYDPKYMGFGTLRVINEDRVIPGAGFGTHPHNNMEIISYVLEGKLAHKDSMGSGSTIKPGDIQIMSAGTGVTHSEYNGSESEEVHFLQIWIIPNVKNEAPNYQQKSFNPEEMTNRFRLVVSPDGENASLLIKQNAWMYAGKFTKEAEVVFPTELSHKYWLQMARGSATINGEHVEAGDGLAIESEERMHLMFHSDSEVLLFDLYK